MIRDKHVISIAKSPKIQVVVECRDGLIDTIDLKSSSAFELSCPSDLNTMQKNHLLAWLEHYSLGKKYPLPINLPENFPPFLKKTLLFLSELPFGSFLCYGDVAQRLGAPEAARAVGNACHRNPFLLLIPCHRVMAKKNYGGFASGINIKIELYNFETNFKLS